MDTKEAPVFASYDDVLDDNLETADFEFGGKWYCVRAWDGETAERMRIILEDKTDKRNRLALTAQTSLIVKATGKLMFADADLPKLARKSVAFLIRVDKELAAINGFTKEGAKKLGEDSAPTAAGDSPSA